MALPTVLLAGVLTNGARHNAQTGFAESVVFLTVTTFLCNIKGFNVGHKNWVKNVFLRDVVFSMAGTVLLVFKASSSCVISFAINRLC